MRGAEGRPQVAFQQFKAGLPGNNGVLGSGSGERRGREQQGSAGNPFTAFIERLAPTGEGTRSQERGLQRIHPYEPYALMDSFNYKFASKRWSELGFQPTEEQNQVVYRVKLVYGIIAEPYCKTEKLAGEQSTAYQQHIQSQIRYDRKKYGNDRIVLTDAERNILVKIAQVAGIPCNPERNEYSYDEIPNTHLNWFDMGSSGVVDADTR